MPRQLDQHLTKYPIIAYRSIFLLQDREGQTISFHRTKTGALRKRRSLLEDKNNENIS